MKLVCRSCGHADFERYTNGRIKPNVAGRCCWPFPTEEFGRWPLALRVAVAEVCYRRQHIWFSDTAECPCWKRRAS